MKNRIDHKNYKKPFFAVITVKNFLALLILLMVGLGVSCSVNDPTSIESVNSEATLKVQYFHGGGSAIDAMNQSDDETILIINVDRITLGNYGEGNFVTVILTPAPGSSLYEGDSEENKINRKDESIIVRQLSFPNVEDSSTHTFTVVSQDKSRTITYTIVINDISTAVIKSFKLSNAIQTIPGIINHSNKTVTLNITNVTNAEWTSYVRVTAGSELSPESGKKYDFSKSTNFAVTSADERSINTYRVTLNRYYEVTIYTNGGLITNALPEVQYVLHSSNASEPEITQDHFGISGWTNDGGDFNFDTPITNTNTIYAEWTNKQYTLTFNANGETPESGSITTNSLSVVSAPTNFSKDHYALEGWYLDGGFTSKYDFTWELSNSYTLYANWTNKLYRVDFYLDGETNKTSYLSSLSPIPRGEYPTPDDENLYAWFADAGFTNLYTTYRGLTSDLSIYTSDTHKVGKTIYRIIAYSKTPDKDDLGNYSNLSQTVFSNYTPGARVTTRYVKPGGSGDGTSWSNAADDLGLVLDGIDDASDDNIYVILVASGDYSLINNNNYKMKNHVAILGGFQEGSYQDPVGETRLDGNRSARVFNNNQNGLTNNNSILYGVTIANGYGSNTGGGGMYNSASSPTLIKVIFSGNKVDRLDSSGYYAKGGGMYNVGSSPTLIEVTFSNNNAGSGGGMYNNNSSHPTLIEVTFSSNTAESGGGMYNNNGSFPTLTRVTFSNNTANPFNGGGMFNRNSFSTLDGVTFSGNTAGQHGGGMYNENSSPTLDGVTFSVNTAGRDGGGMYNEESSPTLDGVTFSVNTAGRDGGGMYNGGIISGSSPTLIGATFSENTVGTSGGGMYNAGSSPNLIGVTFYGNGGGAIDNQSAYDGNTSIPVLINTLIWGHTTTSITGDVAYSNIYHSLIEGYFTYDANPSNGNVSGTSANYPNLQPLADNGGRVKTHKPQEGDGYKFPTEGTGAYVRGVKRGDTYAASDLYYSSDNAIWHKVSDNQPVPLPEGTDDLTATDARGYGRNGRPDIGAYEVGGTAAP